MNAIENNEFHRAWRGLGERLVQPSAVLCISAHWETHGLRVTSSAAPATIHDFHGFPEALFRVRYPAPGDPTLAAGVSALTGAVPDPERGLDHGAWSVLRAMFPDARVPVVQLSLDRERAPADMLQLGRRLAPLRADRVLILGSGNVVHNLGRMDWNQQDGFGWAGVFLGKVKDRIRADDADALTNWPALGPEAALAVPTAEHFLPLLPVLGARAPGESADFLTDRAVNGSIGMTSVLLGGATVRA